MSLTYETSHRLFAEARQVLPGGVDSPVRAYQSVGLEPPFIARGEGSHIIDVDGNDYVDYVDSWGPLILGHNHPAIREAVISAASRGLSFGAPVAGEADLARLMCRMVPGLEMVRFVNSGTEAVMSALRLARAATRRDKVIKFEGCYHGHVDSMLVKAGSGALTGGVPNSPGVPAAVTADTLLATYNDLESVERLLAENTGEVACVIVEPVAANMGVVPPEAGFLEGLRKLCDASGALLIFDEVITGFRLAAGGAQERFGVHADLVTYGKVIGAGMPVGAYGGSRKLMELVAPAGPVYQAGTLSGNPVAMAAGAAQLEIISSDAGFYDRLDERAARLMQGLVQACARAAVVQGVGSLACVYFSAGEPVRCYADALACDTDAFSAYFAGMLDRGVYLAPSQFEALFVSAAHTDADIDATINAAREVFGGLRERD